MKYKQPRPVFELESLCSFFLDSNHYTTITPSHSLCIYIYIYIYLYIYIYISIKLFFIQVWLNNIELFFFYDLMFFLKLSCLFLCFCEVTLGPDHKRFRSYRLIIFRALFHIGIVCFGLMRYLFCWNSLLF